MSGFAERRPNFSALPVLAFRPSLPTFLDSDRILVLDDGHVSEFDTPSALLAKKDGIFKAMVEKSKASHSGSIEES